MTPVRTKTECAKLVARGLATETFEHETLGHFNISELRALIAAAVAHQLLKLHRCRFDEAMMVDGIPRNAMEYLFSHREIDFKHAMSLTPKQLETPLTFLSCPPGTNGAGESHLLVDGIHRMWARKQRGYIDIKFYLLPLSAAPRINPHDFNQLDWGEKEVVPGRGLIQRGT